MTTCTLIRRLTALAATLALTLALQAQTPTKNFNLPADSAMNAIKAFSGQSGVEVLMPTDAVKSIRTNAVRGSMSPREALEKMVEGTGLTVSRTRRPARSDCGPILRRIKRARMVSSPKRLSN